MMKNDFLFNVIVLVLFIGLVCILYVMVSPNKSSNNMLQLNNSTIVVEIRRLDTFSRINFSINYANYDVRVLDSGNPDIIKSADYQMRILEEQAGYLGMTESVAPKELVNGVIIKVTSYNDYNGYYGIDSKNITVYVEADPDNKTAWDNAWKQKITIIN